MVMTSIFARPRARSRLQAVSQASGFRDVYTEDELRTALTEAIIVSNGSTYIGKAIRVCAPITVGSPFVIPSSTPGLTINGQRFPMTPTAQISCVFSLESYFVTIRDVVVVNSDPLKRPSSFVCVPSGKVTIGSSVKDCLISDANALVVVASSGANSNLSIEQNIFASSTAIPAYAIDLGNSAGSTVRGNMFGSPVGNFIYNNANGNIIANNSVDGDIVGGPSSSNTVISGNHMNFADINTSASVGGNSIVGNTNVGTITNAATDAVTSNT